jgi:NhaP-type Na+/H+ or K+/H+ antiporter
MAETSHVPEEILFLIMTIFAGGTVLIVLQSRWANLARIPYTVAMFIYGMVVGVILPRVLPDATASLAQLPPQLIFHIFLPVLIFEGSYGIKIHALGQVMHQVILLAVVGLLINAVLIAGPAMLCFPSWSVYTAMLFGSLLSATDPVAVVSLLKGLGVDKRITALVDGEAIMNDGTAIITYSLLFPAALAGEWVTSSSDVLMIVIRCSACSYAFGTLCGIIQAFALRRTGDGLVQACMTVAFTYVAYYIADEIIETSPVLVMLFQGIYLSSNYPSLFPGSTAHGHSVIATTWEFLVHFGNTVLFSLVGIIVVGNITISFVDVIKIVAIYLTMVIGRFLMIYSLTPLLNLKRFQLGLNEVMLLTHGGLRGGVATALALGLYQTSEFPEGRDILKMTAGVVGLTLLINATTAGPVVSFLGLKTKPKHRIFQMEFAMKFVKERGLNELAKSRRDATLQFANFKAVSQFVDEAKSPYTDAKIKDESDDVMVNMLLMNAFKSGIWRLRDEDSIPETSVRRLAELTSRCMYRRSLLKASEVITECALPPLWFRFIQKSDILKCIPMCDTWCKNFQRRHNYNYFLMLLSCAEVFGLVDHIKRPYVMSDECMQRVTQWIQTEREELQREIDLVGPTMGQTRRKVATARAARRSIRAMDNAVDELHEEHGFSVPVVNDLRAAVAGLKDTADDLAGARSDDEDEDTARVDAFASDISFEEAGSPSKTKISAHLRDVLAVRVIGDAPTQVATIDTCVEALCGSVLGADLDDGDLSVLIGQSRLRRIAAGSSWVRPEGSSAFFVIASGVVEHAWDEQGVSSVLYASYALRFAANLRRPSSQQANNSFPTLFPPKITAITDVMLLEFAFDDFIGDSQPAVVAESTPRSLKLYPTIISKFWSAVAAEALLPYVALQQTGPNAEAVTPFLLSRAGTVLVIEENDSPFGTNLRISQDIFVIDGEDSSGLYITNGVPLPVPKTALPQLRWKRGAIIYILELHFFKSSESTSGIITMNQWFDAKDIVQSQSSTYDDTADDIELQDGVHGEYTPATPWKDLIATLMARSGDDRIASQSAHIVPSNVQSLNAMHTALFCAVERVTIAMWQFGERQGGMGELRSVLRTCTDEAVRLVLDYCCRAEDLVSSHKGDRVVFSLQSSAPPKQLLLNRDPYMDALRSLRRDVCSWTTSRMVMYSEQERVASNVCKRVADFLVHVLECTTELTDD